MVFQTEDRTRAKKQQADAAIQLALRGQWEQAADINRNILESFPSDVDACNRLGKALAELGQYGEARDSYMRAIEIDPLNSIARKNLGRLATLGDGKAKKSKARKTAAGGQKLSPQMFIEETGKTGVATLAGANMEVANRLTAGDQVKLARDKKGNLQVHTMSGEYVGDVESRLGQRLVKMMEGGNEYVAAVAALLEDGVKVFIRETFQHASQAGKLSFPPAVTESVRPYVKSRLVRSDRDDEPVYESDESDDWSSSDDDEDEDASEIRQRAARARSEDDDEIEE